jgi:hypothetical protein
MKVNKQLNIPQINQLSPQHSDSNKQWNNETKLSNEYSTNKPKNYIFKRWFLVG